MAQKFYTKKLIFIFYIWEYKYDFLLYITYISTLESSELFKQRENKDKHINLSELF